MLIRVFIYISLYLSLIFIVFPNTGSHEQPLFIYKVKNSLSLIAKHQDDYFREYKRYTPDIEKLGVKLYPNYNFEIIVSQDGKAYKVKAASKPGWRPDRYVNDKEFKDVWMIDQDYNLERLVNKLNEGYSMQPAKLLIYFGIPVILLIDLLYCTIKKIGQNKII